MTTVERAPFQQADIAIEMPAEFERLQSAFARVFAAPAVEPWLRLLKSRRWLLRAPESIVSEFRARILLASHVPLPHGIVLNRDRKGVPSIPNLTEPRP